MKYNPVKDLATMTENVQHAYQEAMRTNQQLNDVITFVDPSQQLAQLPETGLMLGTPIALKDNVCTKGIKTTAASNILKNYVPIYDATIVKKLRQAGAVTIAKTSMDELAMGGTNLTANIGPAKNPYDLTRITGGSSGGSAAIVASGVVDFAIGSDTGDSIRKPASFCGIVGMKPTYGRISRYGIIPYASSLDHVGYFTRSIEDAAIGLEVLSGRDDLDMTTADLPTESYYQNLNGDLTGKRFAVIGNVIDNVSRSETKQIFNQLMDQLRQKGAIVDVVYMDEKLMQAILPTYFIIANCEATSNHSNLDGIRFGIRQDGADMEEIMKSSRTKGFGELIRRRFVIGSYGLFEENQERLFRKAQKVRRLIVQELDRVLKEYDCIIAPASGDVAPHIESDQDLDRLSDDYLVAENYMAIANFSGYPSLTVPMGYIEGMPIGVNLTCTAFAEQLLLNLGLGIQNVTGLKDAKKEVK